MDCIHLGYKGKCFTVINVISLSVFLGFLFEFIPIDASIKHVFYCK